MGIFDGDKMRYFCLLASGHRAYRQLRDGLRDLGYEVVPCGDWLAVADWEDYFQLLRSDAGKIDKYVTVESRRLTPAELEEIEKHKRPRREWTEAV